MVVVIHINITGMHIAFYIEEYITFQSRNMFILLVSYHIFYIFLKLNSFMSIQRRIFCRDE